MMPHERILCGIYTAAADETQWPGVLERLAEAYAGGVAGFNDRIGRAGLVRSARLARVDPTLIPAIQATTRRGTRGHD